MAVEAGTLYEVGEAVYRFSEVTDNLIYASAAEAGWDDETASLSPDSPAYRDLPDFRTIPVERIGIIS